MMRGAHTTKCDSFIPKKRNHTNKTDFSASNNSVMILSVMILIAATVAIYSFVMQVLGKHDSEVHARGYGLPENPVTSLIGLQNFSSFAIYLDLFAYQRLLN